jgi:Tol biopolymer transport system component/DNA-binding winged helix-turn-helix (wHTH) protein
MNGGEISLPGNGFDIQPFRVGDWRVEPALKRLSRGAESVQVEPRIMHVLTCLARRPGEVVSRPDLLEAVWGDVVVNEEALTHAISQLRRVFGDDARTPGYIQTIHKTGYRLIAPVTPGPPGASPREPERSGAPDPISGAQPGDNGMEAARKPGRRKRIAALAAAVVPAAAILLTAILSRTTSSVAPPPVALDAIPFTTYGGTEECPAISPDGTRIAFSWYTEERGNHDLFVKQRNTESPLRLTETEGSEAYAAWSPDGADLAYALLAGDGSAIYTIPAIGGSPRKLLDAPFGVTGLDWSPDGRYLAYATRPYFCSPNRIHVYSFETGESRELTSPAWSSQGDFRPAFSPDGSRIAFVRGDRTWLQDIFLVPAEGGEAERLTRSQHHIAGLDWMPDGESIVFSAGPSRAGDLRLWRLSLKDGSVTWLPTPGHRAARPSVAAAGSRLVYEEQTYNSNIERVRVGGGGGSETIVASTRHDYGPQYSPGGGYISFISNRSGSPQIWICDRDGGGCRQLTEFENAYIENPCWSYDERRVAFTAAPGSYTAIYVADIEAGQVRRLSTSDRHEMCLGWSRDGEWLYCKSEQNDAWWVWKIRADGSETVDIMEKSVYRLSESSDGRRLIYSRTDTTGVWCTSAEGTDEACLVNEPGVVVPCGWREDADGIYYFNLYEGDVCMWFKDARTGEATMLASEDDFHAIDIDVAPSGEAVIFDRVEHTGSDLSIVENFH